MFIGFPSQRWIGLSFLPPKSLEAGGRAELLKGEESSDGQRARVP